MLPLEEALLAVDRKDNPSLLGTNGASRVTVMSDDTDERVVFQRTLQSHLIISFGGDRGFKTEAAAVVEPGPGRHVNHDVVSQNSDTRLVARLSSANLVARESESGWNGVRVRSHERTQHLRLVVRVDEERLSNHGAHDISLSSGPVSTLCAGE